jgi:hypothetical protein
MRMEYNKEISPKTKPLPGCGKKWGLPFLARVNGD